MARSWLVDGRGIARKVKNATLPSADQIEDCGANLECPKCHHPIKNSDVSDSWPGLPVGVKFDPSDAEILDHLAAKSSVANCIPHMLMDEFIPTLDGANGICYSHPENLPGAKEDGSNLYFFHRTMAAYSIGRRKRRKIQTDDSSIKEHVRWHKTGKTRPVMENGYQKGCKKILVLYKSSVQGSKPSKASWIMHQYHLGTDEDEKDGEYVVSKIFFQQPRLADKSNNVIAITEQDQSMTITENDQGAMRTTPTTPMANTPNPPRPTKSDGCDDTIDDYLLDFAIQEEEFFKDMSLPSSQAHIKNEIEYPYLAGESQLDDLDIEEILNSYFPLDNSGLHHDPSLCARDFKHVPTAERCESFGIPVIEDIVTDTPPDFELSVRYSQNLQFGSQDSIFGHLDL